MDHPETYFETISIEFLLNLHGTEALRLLEGVQPILQPAKMLASYTATLLSFFSAAFTTCHNVGQLHSHSSEFFSRLHLQPAKMLVGYTATLLSFFPAVFTTCQNVGWLHSHSSEFFPAVFTACQNTAWLHSHSSEFFPHCIYNLPKCCLITQPLF